MSKRKSKLTKMLDRLISASEARAHRESRDPSEYDEIDEELFLAKSHLQYYVEQLEKKVNEQRPRSNP